MKTADHLVTEHIDLWTSAIKAKATMGRGSNKKRELYGIKKLRELILELAVRGKLVSQDPTDEPASVLLERLESKKALLVKNKLIKKTNLSTEINDGEEPFELPTGWAFKRFIDVLDFSGGGQPPKSFFSEEKLDGYVQLIQIRDLGPNPQPIYVPIEKVSKFCTSNDVMVGRYGASVGKVFWGKEGAYNVALIKIHNHLEVYSSGFIYLLLKSPLGQSLFGGISRSAQDGFSKNDIAPRVIPVLSLAEQHRIVTKVDELMALCDQLEQQTETSINAHATLVETLLATLTNSAGDVQDAQVSRKAGKPKATATELEENWNRIAEHFDTLFTTEHSIDQLKQTILQLAVMGKLVPQNPNDEPASVLLEKIAAEKAQLVKDKKIKKQKPLPPIGEDEKPFKQPQGWGWCRLQETVLILGDGLHGTPQYDEKGEYYFVNGNNLRDGKIVIKADTKRVNREEYEKHRKHLNERTVLVSINGTLGNLAFFNDEPVMLGKSACYFNLGQQLDKHFYKRLVESPYFLEYAFSKATGSTIKNLGLKAMNAMPIGLPPLEEQHRIVAKVDQLMTFCDQLTERLQHAQQTQLHLADALVEQAVG